jgi:hypothetical protein
MQYPNGASTQLCRKCKDDDDDDDDDDDEKSTHQ